MYHGPPLLSGAVPARKTVTSRGGNGAGVYAPEPVPAAAALTAWLAEGPRRWRNAARAKALGRPNAAAEIAEEIHVQAQRAPIRTHLGARSKGADPTLRPTPEDNWVI